MKVCVDCGDNHENEYEHCDNCIEMYEQTNDNQATELETLRRQVEGMQKAFEAIHVIASETFESHNQLELIRLKAVEHLKGGETK